MKILLIGLALFNAYVFLLAAWDKFQAGRGGWRIAESRLKTLAFFGGSVGLVSAMQLLRHKTRKASFYWPVYASLALHFAIVVLIKFF